MEKTMDFIEDMIMNIQFMKVEKWHYYAKIIEGFKTHILNKDLDCYEFNPSQFQPDYDKVIEQLKRYKSIKSGEESNKLKQQLKFYTEKIEKVQEEKLKDMFVKHPYKSQNFQRKDVNTSSLFASYFRHL